MPAERSQKREILIGGAVMAALFVTFFGIFFLADFRRMFLRTDELHVLMPSAAGLATGSEVWVAGAPVGEVKEIEVRAPGVDSMRRVAIRVEVQRRHLEHIRRDSEARITTFRMIGDPVLDISPGTPAAPAVKAGDSVYVRRQGTIAATMEKAINLQAAFKDLVANTRSIKAQNQHRVAQTAELGRHLAVTAAEFREFTMIVQDGPMNVLNDPEFIGVLSGLSTTIDDLQASFNSAAERVGRARSDAGPAFERLAARADTIQQEIAKLQASIANSGGGLLVRAQTDTAIVKGLHRAQAQLDSLIAESKRNPLRFWF